MAQEIEHRQGDRLPSQPSPHSDGWLEDNVVHPFINGTGLVQIYDTLAGKPAEVETVPQAKSFSPDWCVQSLSAAAGAIVPYVVAGKLTGMGMRAVGDELKLSGTAARLITSDSLAQIAGAGIYQFAQKPLNGETRIGNAVGTMAGFALFSGGNLLADRAAPVFSSSISRVAARGAIRFAAGSVGGLGSFETTNLVDGLQGLKHQETWQQRWQAMAQGGFINAALPVVQEGASKVIDKTIYSQPFSKGTPVDREIKNNQISDPEIVALASENPLARVKRGADVTTSADLERNVALLNSSDGLEKVAHELSHLTIAKQAESFYQEIGDLARTDPQTAERSFIALRSYMEGAARATENRVAESLRGTDFQRVVDDPALIGETVAANGKTYNQNWQAEWQAFQKDPAFRPQTEYSGVPGIVEWTSAYEKWMSDHIKVVPDDLAKKHTDMASDPFLFMRGTYYRWAKMFPEVLPELNKAPVVRAVGDLHTGNFGTWVDRIGRLIWGINDFDEAHPLPYTNDLVRLTTSANLLKMNGGLHIGLEDAAGAILDGYKQGLEDGGKPFVLGKGSDNGKLEKIAVSQMPKAGAFWRKLRGQLTGVADSSISEDASSALDSILPSRHGTIEIGQRQAGEGSLGRERFVAITKARGSNFAAEAKAYLPSAFYFASGEGDGKSYFTDIINHAVRAKDPYVGIHDDWVVRRLGPKNAKIDLGELARVKDERRLLYAMGYETANIHLGTKGAAKTVLADLADRKDNWLYKATKKMTASTLTDHEDWKQHMNGR